jgi:hypothetical protein
MSAIHQAKAFDVGSAMRTGWKAARRLRERCGAPGMAANGASAVVRAFIVVNGSDVGESGQDASLKL